jgi:translation initiation factor 5A
MSNTTPTQSGTLQKGSYICINEHPCKITDCVKAKTGKHGSCKVHFTAVDIFTDKKYESMETSTANVDVPNVTKTDYQLLDIDEDNTVSYLDENENALNDLVMPNLCEKDKVLAQELKEAFADEENEIYITVVSAMDIKAIKGFRVKK